MRTRVLLSPVLAFAAASAIGAGTYAAYSAATDNAGNQFGAGSVALHDDDGDAAILSLTDAGPGASATGCLRVSSDGSLPSLVRMRSQTSGDLLPHLAVRITRGSGSAAGGDCGGFTADARDHFGLGAGVVYDGPLAGLPATWGLGMRDPAGPLPANSGLALAAARSTTAGLWEFGERISRADDFAGAHGTLLSAHGELLGAAWTRLASSSQHAAITRGGGVAARGEGHAAYTVPVVGGDQVVDATVRAGEGDGEAGITIRAAAAADNGYTARYRRPAGVWELVRVTGGTATVLDSWTAPLPQGRAGHLRLRHSGGTLSAVVTTHTGDTHTLSSSDATYASSLYAGIRLAGGGVELDDFRVQLVGQALTNATVGTNANQAGAGVALESGVQPSATDLQASARFTGGHALRLPTSGLATAVTVAGWFRHETGAALLRDSSTGSAGWSLGYDDEGRLKYRVSGETFDTGIATDGLRNTWRHHALVRDGADVRYFLDGRLVHSATVTATTPPASPWWLMRNGSTGTYSTGNADQVAIWSRAVTAGELGAIRDGVARGGTWHQGDEHAYRIQVTVGTGIDVAAKSAQATFDWEARNR